MKSIKIKSFLAMLMIFVLSTSAFAWEQTLNGEIAFKKKKNKQLNKTMALSRVASLAALYANGTQFKIEPTGNIIINQISDFQPDEKKLSLEEDEEVLVGKTKFYTKKFTYKYNQKKVKKAAMYFGSGYGKSSDSMYAYTSAMMKAIRYSSFYRLSNKEDVEINGYIYPTGKIKLKLMNKKVLVRGSFVIMVLKDTLNEIKAMNEAEDEDDEIIEESNTAIEETAESVPADSTATEEETIPVEE